MTIFSSLSFWRKIFIRGGLTFLFFSIFTAGVLASIPKSGSLYPKWMKKIFISLPEETVQKKGFEKKLKNPTVQKSHSLVDENEKEIAWGTKGTDGQKQLLIGEKIISSDTVKISGENATIKITAQSGNPEISLGETSSHHGSIYTDQSGEMRIWNQENAVEIGNKVNFPQSIKSKNINLVSVFTCEEGSGLLVGFDEDANAICSDDTDITAWVSTPKTGVCSKKCGGGQMEYNITCRNKDNYSNILDDKICENLGLQKPPSLRPCNEFVCQPSFLTCDGFDSCVFFGG